MYCFFLASSDSHKSPVSAQVAAQAAALQSELTAAQQTLAEVRDGAAATEARAARLDAKAAQQQTVCNGPLQNYVAAV